MHFDQPHPQALSHSQVTSLRYVSSLLLAACPPAAHLVMDPDILEAVQKGSAASGAAVVGERPFSVSEQ